MDPLPAAPRLIREDGSGSPASEVLGIEAYIVAQRFHQLPEPERSALSLIYLDLFDVSTICEVLGLTLEELASVLGRARTQLQEALKQDQSVSVSS